jgi:hypothetical protein
LMDDGRRDDKFAAIQDVPEEMRTTIHSRKRRPRHSGERKCLSM